MAFTNEEVMRATELALRQYHVVQKEGGAAAESLVLMPQNAYAASAFFGLNITDEYITGEVVLL